MQLIHPEVQEYAERMSEPPDALLLEIEEFTLANHEHSQMISGALQGKVLEMFSKMLRPKYILEIGTFTGFSALCLAGGLAEGGELHTIEVREADADTAAGYFKRSLYADRIILHRGNALDMVPKLQYPWDIVFIDADKAGYIQYYELTLPLLKQGGIILADNVFFHGEVLNDKMKGKHAKAIRDFNGHVAKDPRVHRVILTVRDGLMMVIKK